VGGRKRLDIVDQAMMQHEKQELQTVRNRKPIEDVGNVVLDGLHADAQSPGDILLRIPSDDEYHDLLFAWGETKTLPACSDSRLFLMPHRAPPLARLPPASSMENALRKNTHPARCTLEGYLTVGVLRRAAHRLHPQLFANNDLSSLADPVQTGNVVWPQRGLAERPRCHFAPCVPLRPYKEPRQEPHS
jgi:hypothetical protein